MIKSIHEEYKTTSLCRTRHRDFVIKHVGNVRPLGKRTWNRYRLLPTISIDFDPDTIFHRKTEAGKSDPDPSLDIPDPRRDIHSG